METRRAGCTAVLAASLALQLAGCSVSPVAETQSPTSGAAPPELSAVLYQSRMDLDDRQVQVKVRNEGDTDVVVERMTLTSSAFAEPMPYPRQGNLVKDGRAVDLPVVLSAPVCADVAPRHTVEVDYRLEDGTTGSAELAAVDEHEAVAALHAAECFALDVGAVATLSMHDLPRVVARDGVLTAELVVDVTAAGTGGADLRVRHVAGTTLLQHLDPTTLARLPQGRDLDVRGPDDGTATFTLALVPNGCDAHAIAEDKQGTRFRVLVDLDGREGVVPLVSPDPVRVALYEFVRQACGEMRGPDG